MFPCVFSCSCARAFSLFTQTLVAACSYFLYRLVIVWWRLEIISSWCHHFTLATKSHNHLAIFCFTIDNCVTGLLILMSSIEYSFFWVVNIFYQLLEKGNNMWHCPKSPHFVTSWLFAQKQENSNIFPYWWVEYNFDQVESSQVIS